VRGDRARDRTGAFRFLGLGFRVAPVSGFVSLRHFVVLLLAKWPPVVYCASANLIFFGDGSTHHLCIPSWTARLWFRGFRVSACPSETVGTFWMVLIRACTSDSSRRIQLQGGFARYRPGCLRVLGGASALPAGSEADAAAAAEDRMADADAAALPELSASADAALDSSSVYGDATPEAVPAGGRGAAVDGDAAPAARFRQRLFGAGGGVAGVEAEVDAYVGGGGAAREASAAAADPLFGVSASVDSAKLFGRPASKWGSGRHWRAQTLALAFADGNVVREAAPRSVQA
jgi:hypothetical protein